jgi:hypothetical protein
MFLSMRAVITLMAIGLLICVNSASAAWTDWTGAVDQDWSNAGNWSGAVPSANTPGVITLGGANGPIITNASAIRYLYLGDSSSTYTARSALGELKITSTGSLEIEGIAASYIGGDTTLTPPDAEGILTVDGGSVNVLANTFNVGTVDNSTGTLLIIHGGTFTSDGGIAFGRPNSDGHLKLYDSTIIANYDNIGGFYVEYGDVDMRGTAKVLWKGDHAANLNTWIAQGKIFAGEEGESMQAAVYDSGTGYTTLQVNPKPPSGTVIVIR